VVPQHQQQRLKGKFWGKNVPPKAKFLIKPSLPSASAFGLPDKLPLLAQLMHSRNCKKEFSPFCCRRNPIHDKLRKDATVREVYKLGRTIGTGGFSVVKMVTDRATGEVLACKVMTLPPPGKKAGDGESTREDIFKEIDILMQMRHENIIYLKEYFEESGRMYVIMEYLAGGELLEALLAKEKGADGTEAHYSEADARIIFRQLINGIKYLHDM